jgi:eukaryotic-like serine/threonine-protein kinase
MTENVALIQRALRSYAIERTVGSGGMADVYLAHDRKHGRKVAVKVLRSEIAAAVGSRRFLQEIRITATLQHPHILGLIDSGIVGENGGELAGRPYYVMPFIEGESLRQRLDREQQLPVAEAVRIVTEVAGALDYAHRQGIIHRDIKPENILLQDGSAIVADFGVALALTQAGDARLTESGLSIGTPIYMSPEQATGERAVTAQSDIYSLGALCYELLAGEPPFTGRTSQMIIGRIVTEEARPLSVVRRSVPAHVAAAVAQALQKVPADRFPTAHAFAEALNDRTFTPAHPLPAFDTGAPRQTSRRPLYLVGALAVVMGATAVWGWMRPTASQRVLGYHLTFDINEGIAAGGSYAGRLALSPDAARLAYIGGPRAQLLIRPRDQLQATVVPGTQGMTTPFFSPDGRSVGVMADLKLQVVSLSGAPPFIVTDSLVGVAGASWARDGYIYADGAGFERLVRVEAKPRGVARWFTTLDSTRGEIDHLWPDALPNGRGVLFTTATQGRKPGIENLSFSIAVAEIPSGKHRVLVDDAKFARYAASGHLLYVTSDRKLMVAPFDQQSMRVTGEAIAFASDIRLGQLGSADLTISNTGTLLYGTGGGLPRNELVWVTRDGEVTPFDSTWSGVFRSPALSPDGKQLAVELGSDIWVKPVDGGVAVRLAFEGTQNAFPAWSPDGRSVTYMSTAAQSYDLWTRKADGSAPAVRQWHMRRGVFGPMWSPNGEWLLFRTDESSPDGSSGSPTGLFPDILGIRPGIDSVPLPIVATQFSEEAPALSPDGRWLAYTSDETGLKEIYVVPFPNTTAAKWPISSGGGAEALWAPNGKELFYRDTLDNLISVAVQTSPTFSRGRSRVLFQARGFVTRAFPAQYAVSRDGRRFLMIRPVPVEPERLVVVENWFQQLQATLRQ